MTSLGDDVYCGTLNYKKLNPGIVATTAQDVTVDDSNFTVIKQTNLQAFSQAVDNAC